MVTATKKMTSKTHQNKIFPRWLNDRILKMQGSVVGLRYLTKDFLHPRSLTMTYRSVDSLPTNFNEVLPVHTKISTTKLVNPPKETPVENWYQFPFRNVFVSSHARFILQETARASWYQRWPKMYLSDWDWHVKEKKTRGWQSLYSILRKRWLFVRFYGQKCQ